MNKADKKTYNFLENFDMLEGDPFKEYRVVINIEDQYSIWPTCKEIPLGWSDAGQVGSKQECLDFIKEVWVDMRPKSLKDAMNQNDSID